jgi:hypothetical protein
MEIIHK